MVHNGCYEQGSCRRCNSGESDESLFAGNGKIMHTTGKKCTRRQKMHDEAVAPYTPVAPFEFVGIFHPIELF